MIATTREIQLFQALKNKLGENEAETMVGYLKDEMKQQLDFRKEIYATKEDLEKLRSGILTSVYGVGLVQLIAIISSVLGIVFFIN
ncbi:hypothetical protein EDD80_11483 [Anseongella ginsenosidimutans]|uniref:DUF1640 domain-containing protein n=1 Tax=Anseongella ginsenosidimutans TaxID=496056 RepID=A0A4R3KMB2_9SPHI|nr:hypothetical protein [Anseongella ginsenosidimutans]QEC54024.1 hypothetical protein FRZ59_17935 [Anseongella ginsenosidimutans]TCS85213.1 hypothetical protein EDD80_11483 [Anseongella ginsenosidimutans]